jgi:hypothetical protein
MSDNNNTMIARQTDRQTDRQYVTYKRVIWDLSACINLIPLTDTQGGGGGGTSCTLSKDFEKL